MSHTDTDTDTNTQPEEAPVWEMPDFTTSPDAIDAYLQEMDEELEAAEAQDEADYLTTVRDHS